MKVLKGLKKSEFINDYCNHSKEKQFLLIDTIDNTYPFDCNNMLILKSDKDNWLKDLKECDAIYENKIFILFTNDKLEKLNYYKQILEKFNREIIVVLQGKSRFMFGETDLQEV